ncbi:hypothetical protein [Actinosynnema mirum]|uniref:Uncharacterized protein n=1 Tax=Actinosynnema mirum (strain ATCC 29888 / DSM 43827 / JCM 3225 / NBRC 14064 / NCIMB 13271 / NRRL B-12336 / IMRU 3971 / 101) TaxID=446462 RepID=C6WBM4_ACTMD|nr:hypothetical protein [Actinosynnema mirum]ACU35592.1 hypothetical protein Amir_1643 [Actinosynnema mirum DSM 43827]
MSPWLGHAPDAPDSHRMWAHPGSGLEAALRASGWVHEVPAPGSEEIDVLPEEPLAPVVPPVVLEQPAEEPAVVPTEPRARRARA